MTWLSKLIDKLSDYLAHRKGLLPMLGILLILANLVLVVIFPFGWLAGTNMLLHIGLIVAIVGFMLSWAL
ncbi:MAG: hypothetical protein AB1750_13980 [Chloroflexota bacterium]